jgi:transcriptional regulator with XRE-family HTH domain
MIEVDVATFLRSCRSEAGLTQRQLAERAGTSAAAVCHYERGTRIPRVDTLVRLVAATGATLTWTTLRFPSDPATIEAMEDNGEALAAVLDPGVTERIVALHATLAAADLPHAFGGALALAFCSAAPRQTEGIVVHVFVPPAEIDRVLGALPDGIAATHAERELAGTDPRVRLRWDETPVDVLLSNHPFHDHAEADRRHVAFAGIERLPVLACQDLAVFKAFSARPKDAVDVATMVALGSVDLDALERSVGALLGDSERRARFFERVAEAVPQI